MSRRGRGGRPRRRVPSKPRKLSLLVFTEGEKTEQQYLKNRYAMVREAVAIEFGGSGAPTNIVERAINAKRRAAREQATAKGRGYDQIWCVFDADQHPNIDAIRQRAEQAGIRVAFSHPCLELWFVLHFEDRFAAMTTRQARERSKELLGCEKALRRSSLARLDDGYDDAVMRAKALERKHRDDGSPVGANPSTSIWRLTELLRTSSERIEG